ncbi:MAG: beta-ketoacyl-[acyl-carrier-protein] synthase II [Planctomycetota bacterium]|nr:MAG: beta-ketoacyl-[acyl-carrier-protein] synthase II [Planctomycetota bacterium]
MAAVNRRRVVVTGLGACTSLGFSFEDTWAGLLAGKSGVTPIRRFDPEAYRTRFAAQVPEFEPARFFDEPMVGKKLDLFTQFSIIAAEDCLRSSGVELGSLDLERFGCIMGTGIGGIMAIESHHAIILERGPRRASPFFIPKMMPNAMSGQLSIRYGLQGTNFATSSACASAGHALGLALRSIQYGEADLMLTGGSEAAVSTQAVAAFGAMKALSTRNDDPQAACRPFDKDRDGFVMGEGAGVLLIEEREHALARGAEILAEFSGYGSTADAFHITQPKEDASGPSRAIELALADAGVARDQVGYVNAHGTSTHFNDLVETRALHNVFKQHARKLAISSSKSMTGHLLGGSGAIEACATVMSLHQQRIHATLNHHAAGEGCDLDYVPGEPRALDFSHAISNSLGFGGHNVCLAFSRHEA